MIFIPTTGTVVSSIEIVFPTVFFVYHLTQEVTIVKGLVLVDQNPKEGSRK